MKKLSYYACCAAIAAAAFLSSCQPEPDEQLPENQPGAACALERISGQSTDGEAWSESYTTDGQGRTTKVSYFSDNATYGYSTMEYQPGKVVIKEYDAQNSLTLTRQFTTNSLGYVTQAEYEDNADSISFSYIAHYEYDSEGYLKKVSSSSSTKDQSGTEFSSSAATYTLAYSNGNVVSGVYNGSITHFGQTITHMYANTYEYSETPLKGNVADESYYGQAGFYGRANANLLQRMTYTSDNNTSTTAFAWELDASGYPKKVTANAGGTPEVKSFVFNCD